MSELPPTTPRVLKRERATSAARPPVMAVVIPAYNAAATIERVVRSARDAATDVELVVVDAGSTDDTGEAAERSGARVVRLPRRAGPAEARNAGVAAVDADVVLFLDSDCLLHRDAIGRVRDAFRGNPSLVALTGSYDESPPERGFFSQYMNLRHHHTHQVAKGAHGMFWGACGAVRVEAFTAVGGFDAKRYPRPMIEDVELGMRLRDLGEMALDPDLQVTHLKRWTLRNVVRTEILCRAVPWATLICESGTVPNDLNLRASQRIAAMLAPGALAAVVCAPLLAMAGRTWLAAGAATILASVLCSLGLLQRFARLRGPWFAARAWLFHQVHLLYSATVFVIVRARHALRPAVGDRR